MVYKIISQQSCFLKKAFSITYMFLIYQKYQWNTKMLNNLRKQGDTDLNVWHNSIKHEKALTLHHYNNSL